MLDPRFVSQLLGINFEYQEELGRFGDSTGRYEIAGSINRSKRTITLALKFPIEVVRFTGAHEVGHWLLHPGERMHRDRPIKGIAEPRTPRPPIEAEADYFAACFLIPEKLLVTAVEGKFRLRTPITIDDTVAFHLCPSNPGSVLNPDHESLASEVAVASATTFNGRHFDSLAQQFQVSISSMAIRLRELHLVSH
jgi:Zn-dependent peptidase ImmA (M78 family)